MKELIEFLARSLVDQPDAVKVEEEDDGDRIIFHLYVADEDMGKVIGEQGRIANAMRGLLTRAVRGVRGDDRAAPLPHPPTRFRPGPTVPPGREPRIVRQARLHRGVLLL